MTGQYTLISPGPPSNTNHERPSLIARPQQLGPRRLLWSTPTVFQPLHSMTYRLLEDTLFVLSALQSRRLYLPVPWYQLLRLWYPGCRLARRISHDQFRDNQITGRILQMLLIRAKAREDVWIQLRELSEPTQTCRQLYLPVPVQSRIVLSTPDMVTRPRTVHVGEFPSRCCTRGYRVGRLILLQAQYMSRKETLGRMLLMKGNQRPASTADPVAPLYISVTAREIEQSVR